MSQRSIFTVMVSALALILLASGNVPAQGQTPGVAADREDRAPERPVVVEGVQEVLPSGLLTAQAPETVPASMTETFEGAWPAAGWTLVDQSSTDDGEYLMGKRNCHPRTGSYAGWMTGGGAKGSTLSCSGTFSPNSNTWAIYGPFDLSGELAASLTFHVWGRSGVGSPSQGCSWDYLFAGSSPDGSNFSGEKYCGTFQSGTDGNGYYRYSLDLSTQRGQSAVWIAFAFVSDDSYVFSDDVGITVDDITLGPYTPLTPVFDAPVNVSNHPEMVNTQPGLARDQQGHVHIAYMGAHYQAGAPDDVATDIFYTNNVGGSFSAPMQINVPTGYYSYRPSIVVDADDVVHIAFARQMDQNSPAGDDDIWYVNNRTGSFANPLKVVDGMAFGAIHMPSAPMIEVDTGGIVHLSFLADDSDLNARVLYTNNGSGSFSTPTVVLQGFYTLYDFVMVLDAQGWPHFSVQGDYDDDEQTFYVKAMSNPLSNPTFSAPVNVSNWPRPTGGYWAALAIDSDYHAHIAFRDPFGVGYEQGLYYVNNTTGVFSAPVQIAYAGYAPWLEFDADGVLHAVYKGGSTAVWYNNNSRGGFDPYDDTRISDIVEFFVPRHFAVGLGNDVHTTYHVYGTYEIDYVRGRYPPLPAQVSASRSGNNVVLSWNHRANIEEYEVHRSTTPYFTPGVLTRLQTLSGSTTTYTDVGALGNPDVTYYYYVVAAQQGVGSKSNPVGEFEFNLITGSTPTWTTITTQDFEGTFPGNWQVFDNNGSQDGEYKWAKRNCQVYAGAYSGWAVGGGANGAPLACGANYPNYASSWMMYGPFSLADATASDLKFKLWLNSETTYDKLFWGASLNGSSFNGYTSSGNSSGWIDRSLDLANVPTLGNLLGQTNVWIALVFSSDSTANLPNGAHIDNIVLRKCTAASCAEAMNGDSGALPQIPAQIGRSPATP